MFGFMKKIINRNKVKKFSTTMTSANEGAESKKDLNPNISNLIKGLKSGDKISHEDVNNILSFYFNVKEIKPGLYTFNKDIVNGMVFEITNVNTVLNKNDDVESMYITLREITYNIDFTTTISGTEFYELFKDFTPNQPPKKRSVSNVD